MVAVIKFVSLQKVYMTCPRCKELVDEGERFFVPQVEKNISDFITEGQLTCRYCGTTIATVEALTRAEFVVRTFKGAPIEITEPFVVKLRTVDPDLEEEEDY